VRAHKRVWRVALYALVFFGALPACADSVIRDFQVVNPRPFGYVIGDTIKRRIETEVSRPFALENDKLPKVGRAGTWLDLREIKLDRSPRLGSTHYRLTLTYQLVNSPEAVENLALPKVSLSFASGNKVVAQNAPEYLFSAAPITPPQVLGGEGLDAMREDQPPIPIPNTLHRVLFLLSLAISILALLYMAYLRFGFPWQRPRPFALAYRDLRRLAKEAGSDEAFRQGMRRVHRALDQTAGRPLFPGELDKFFVKHPRFANMQRPTQRFFEISQSEFFGKGAREQPMEWLVKFCREWRAAEAG